MTLSAFTLSVLMSLALLSSVEAHPQCLDGKPPFASSPQLRFCTEYQNLGCCTAVQDRQIQAKYQEASSSVSSHSQTCKSYMKAILCQQCSPYAAHLYSYEETGVASPLPGLCFSYCTRVYNTCGAENLALLDDNEGYRTALRSHASFCGYIQLADMDYCYPNLKSNSVLNERYVGVRQNADTEGCMCLQTVAQGHGLITFIESNPIDDNLMYVGEQKGLVYVYENGVKRRRPFLDLSRDVLLSTFVGDERGLLGLVFHPAFSTNRQFFVYYVLNTEQGQTVRISHWIARNRYTARKGSERLLLDISQPYFNHNGGQLLFGEDGYLYIFTGDGGGAGDPLNNGQNLQTLYGKALRIDVNGRRRGTYGIPPDNPFRTNGRGEIYAYGLRNAWKCSKDSGDPLTGTGRGRIFCGDVGQNKFEEIDIIVKGGNYGWGTREGFECFSSSRRPDRCGQIGPEELPIYAYNHSFGKSITGGYVYRGCEYPELNGAYIYGDFTSGRIFKLDERRQQWFNTEIQMCSPFTCTGNWVSSYGKGITSFGTNSQGDILMTSTSDNSAHTDGSSIYKLIMQPFRRSDPSRCTSNEVSFQSKSGYTGHPLPAGFSENSTNLNAKPHYTTTRKPVTRKPVTRKPATRKPTTRKPPAVYESEEETYYNLLTETISRRQRHLADLIAQYEALLMEMAAAEELTTRSSMATRTPQKSTASTTAITRQNISSKKTYSWHKTTNSKNLALTTTTPSFTIRSRRSRYWESATTLPTTTSTRAAASTRKRTYSWQKLTYYPITTTSSPMMYSWQKIVTPRALTIDKSNDRQVIVRRHKVTTARPHNTLPKTTRKIYSWRTPSTKRKLYSWETNPTTKRKAYSWEKTTPTTRRQLYSWQTTPASKAQRKLYSWETTTSAVKYKRVTVQTTSASVGFVTNYELPGYLKAEDNGVRSWGGPRVVPTFYQAPERTYLSNNRYDFSRDAEEWRSSPYYFWMYK